MKNITIANRESLSACSSAAESSKCGRLPCFPFLLDALRRNEIPRGRSPIVEKEGWASCSISTSQLALSSSSLQPAEILGTVTLVHYRAHVLNASIFPILLTSSGNLGRRMSLHSIVTRCVIANERWPLIPPSDSSNSRNYRSSWRERENGLRTWHLQGKRKNIRERNKPDAKRHFKISTKSSTSNNTNKAPDVGRVLATAD